MLFAFGLACSACGPSNADLRSKLENRAAFDLGCQSLQLTALESTNGYVTTYGVIGCGHRATYVLNAQTLSWVMNVSDGAAASPPTDQGKR